MTATVTCPAWCSDHDDETTSPGMDFTFHRNPRTGPSLDGEGWQVDAQQADDEPPRVWVEYQGRLTLLQARAMAQALWDAASEAERPA